MTGTKIQAAESSIRDIFTDNYRFSIPRYQRPYAWTAEQAGEMLEDLVLAARCERNLAISLHRLTGATNIAVALRHHARDPTRPLQLLKII